MRTILTPLLTVFMITLLQGQVTLDVLDPPELAGTYVHTWAEPQDGSWNTPDMTDPDERVVGSLAMAMDNSEADSLVCSSVLDPSSLAGKVALLYRGTCDYSVKAKHCQDAGAIAVVIINNVNGTPPGMGAGSIGEQVTIPVFQCTKADGETFRAALEAGAEVSLLLGNKNGFYLDDVGFHRTGILMPRSLAYPELLTTSPDEYHIEVAAWVHNYGQNNRNDLVLRAVIEQDGAVLYDEVSPSASIASGDSAFMVLPDFFQNGYAGDYTLEYSLSIPGNDQHMADNEFQVPFHIGDHFSLVPLSVGTFEPATTIGIQPATPSGEYESCVHFRDPNASRVAVEGIHLHALKNTPATLQGTVLSVRVHQWLDEFTGLSDPNFNVTQLFEMASTEYFPDADTNVVSVYVPFEEPILLQDDLRYLFCVTTLDNDMFFGYNENIHYATNEQVYDQPIAPSRNGETWFIGGFVGGPVPSIAVRMVDATMIGIQEHDAHPLRTYPNPSSGIFQVSVDGHLPGWITLSDVAGRVVRTIPVTSNTVTIDLRGEAAGVYAITVRSASGQASGRIVLE